MPDRCRRLIGAVLPLAALLALSGPAEAHRLEADYQVLSGNRIQIESWFDLTGVSARGAKVRVYLPDGALLSEGEMDENGTFIFSVPNSGPFKVVISAGAEHRTELVIPREALEQAASASAPRPFADRSPRVTYGDMLTGIAFVLALASFVLSLRNARRLQKLEEK
jgi:hypothetical protein